MRTPRQQQEQPDPLRKLGLFFAAIEKDDVHVLKMFLKDPAISVHTRNVNKVLPLIWAVQHRALKAADVLLARGARIDAVDAQGRSALLIACLQNDLPMIDHLLRHGASLGVQKRGGCLSVVLQPSPPINYQVRELVIRHAIDQLPRSREKDMVLAIQKGNVGRVRAFLDSGFPITFKFFGKYSLLVLAIMVRQDPVAHLLIDRGCAIEVGESHTVAEVPLTLAIMRRARSVVKKMIALGVNVNHIDQQGITPLSAAVFSGQLDMVDQLLRAGANVNLHHQSRPAPIFIAIAGGHVRIVERLLAVGAQFPFGARSQPVLDKILSRVPAAAVRKLARLGISAHASLKR